MSDRDAARKLGRPYAAVQSQRIKPKIPNAHLLTRPWTRAELKLPGTAADAEVGRTIRRSTGAVRTRRRISGIPDPCRKNRPGTQAELAELGKLADGSPGKTVDTGLHSSSNKLRMCAC